MNKKYPGNFTAGVVIFSSLLLASGACVNNTLIAAESAQNDNDLFVKPVEIVDPDSPAAPATPAAEKPRERVISVTSRAEHIDPLPVADDKKAPDDSNKPAPTAPTAPATASKSDGTHVTLDDAVEIAILNNLTLKIDRLNDRESDIAVRDAWAQFYPTFGSSLIHSNSKTAGHNDGRGVNTLSGTVSQQTPWGTKLDFITSESRADFNRASAQGNVQLNVAQPLWRGRSTDANLSAVRQARINRLISRGNLDLETQQLIFQVRSNYAEVIRQLQQRDVNQESVRTAKTFLELTGARYKAGQVTQLDVFNAEVQLHSQELNLITTERVLDTDLDRLKQLLDLPLEEVITVDATVVKFGEHHEAGLTKTLEADDASGSVVLVTRKEKEGTVVSSDLLFEATHFDQAVVLKEALENRLDLLNSRRNVAISKLQALLTKDGLGHQIDLVGSIGRTDAGRALLESDNHSETLNWNFGLQATFPWGKIKDRDAYETALLELQKSEIALKQAWTNVQIDVRNTLRLLHEAEKALLIEGRRVEQSKRSVEAAQISFERGLKDTFDVIIAQNDLLSAKTNFINRKQDYIVDLAQLELVVGKPTGRVNLTGDTVGGLIDAKMPDDPKLHALKKMADPTPTEAEDPLNNSRGYRKDYRPKTEDPIFIETPEAPKPKAAPAAEPAK